MVVRSQKTKEPTEHTRITFHLELHGGFDTNGELIVLQRNTEPEVDKKCHVRQ